MIGFKHFALVALGATQAWSASAGQVKRQATTAKYCPGGTSICFSEYSVDSQGVVYRIAIPDVKAAPFDILLQIVAPKTVGWAGIAWGGKMTSNPLTLGWPNANTAIVSSRWTSGKSMPGAYTEAKYTVLPTTTSNSTHWQLDVVCQGCSKWQGGELNPNGANALAWAKNTKAVITPSSNTSNFAGHDARGIFSHDLSQAKIPQGIFDAVAYDLENTPAPAPSSAALSVATSVLTLPNPASSSNPILSIPISSILGPLPVSSVLGPLPIPTRLTVLPGLEPTRASRTGRVVTSVTQLVPPKPFTSTVFVIPTPKPATTVVTVIVTVRPPTTTARASPTLAPWQPPQQGGGGGWGGGGWGGGRGGGPGRGRRPGEEEE